MGVQEYLVKKGFKKIHQSKKRYNLSIGELVSLIEEFANQQADYRIPNTQDIKQQKLWM
ncbi:MAG: hypothetical protein PVH48_03740 [Cyclobacteriaceae bacterium]|jgi:hypothetical protein